MNHDMPFAQLRGQHEVMELWLSREYVDGRRSLSYPDCECGGYWSLVSGWWVCVKHFVVSLMCNRCGKQWAQMEPYDLAQEHGPLTPDAIELFHARCG